VSCDADAAAVRVAFARRVRALHPDTAGHPENPRPVAAGSAVAGASGELAALIAARDELLGRGAAPAPAAYPAPVVFYKRRGLVRRLTAVWRPPKRRSRKLS
jgi:hypothetical protein